MNYKYNYSNFDAKMAKISSKSEDFAPKNLLILMDHMILTVRATKHEVGGPMNLFTAFLQPN